MKRLAAAVLLLASLMVVAAAPADAYTSRVSHRVQLAAKYASEHGMTVGVAVVDTLDGSVHIAGRSRRLFGSASVVKTLIATRLLLEHRMWGDNSRLAWLMITRSDNDAADFLYDKVGRDDLLPWLAAHYDLPRLGTRPTLPGYWGTTQLRPRGLAKFYAAIRHDPTVWPWLGNAMHAWHRRSTAGEPNDFGLGGVAPDAAVKNGWVINGSGAIINTTGFVGHDRYAVVILTQGPGSYYYATGERIVTRTVKILLNYGVLDG